MFDYDNLFREFFNTSAIRRFENSQKITQQIISSQQQKEAARYEYDMQHLTNLILGFHTGSASLTSEKLKFINDTHKLVLLTLHSHQLSSQLYIQHNYQKYLIQDFIASLFYLNRSYRSTLFRQTTRTKFVDYLNSVRIEKAKEILENSDRKMYQVAKAVGYDNTKYFFRIFKKIVGISPEQYRKERRG